MAVDARNAKSRPAGEGWLGLLIPYLAHGEGESMGQALGLRACHVSFGMSSPDVAIDWSTIAAGRLAGSPRHRDLVLFFCQFDDGGGDLLRVEVAARPGWRTRWNWSSHIDAHGGLFGADGFV